ncbi:MAG: hypothetical protein H7336_15460 [Bacteriovorax sp.]|nr:hypothetical protein [Bacteriovorax sp.]
MKLTTTSKYYTISFLFAGIFWSLLQLCQIEFPNIIFFLTAYVWHFALVTPGLKENVMTKHHKLSFLAVVVRMNHYLQIFINLKRIPYGSSIIRAISPAIFTFILFVVGGTGNILFTLLGSFCFELVYQIVKKKTKLYDSQSLNPLEHISDLNTPLVILNEEKIHE